MRTVVLGCFAHCFDGECGRRGSLSGWDEEVVVVAHHKLQDSHMVERVARNVYFSTLAFAQQHSVIAHPRVPGSEPSHAHGFHATRPAIVAQVDPRQAVQSIGYVGNTHLQQVTSPEDI